MASFRLQCCAANTRDQDRRQSGVTCTQHTTPNGPVHRAAQHGSGHPGLQPSAPTSYPTSGLGRVKTARVTNCAVLVFLGTKPGAINNREYFRENRETPPLSLFPSANTGNYNQLCTPSCTQVASALVLSAEPQSLTYAELPAATLHSGFHLQQPLAGPNLAFTSTICSSSAVGSLIPWVNPAHRCGCRWVTISKVGFLQPHHHLPQLSKK